MKEKKEKENWYTFIYLHERSKISYVGGGVGWELRGEEDRVQRICVSWWGNGVFDGDWSVVSALLASISFTFSSEVFFLILRVI